MPIPSDPYPAVINVDFLPVWAQTGSQQCGALDMPWGRGPSSSGASNPYMTRCGPHSIDLQLHSSLATSMEKSILPTCLTGLSQYAPWRAAQILPWVNIKEKWLYRPWLWSLTTVGWLRLCSNNLKLQMTPLIWKQFSDLLLSHIKDYFKRDTQSLPWQTDARTHAQPSILGLKFFECLCSERLLPQLKTKRSLGRLLTCRASDVCLLGEIEGGIPMVLPNYLWATGIMLSPLSTSAKCISTLSLLALSFTCFGNNENQRQECCTGSVSSQTESCVA